MDEANAIEAFELERQRVAWYNEGVILRNALLEKQRRQLDCLNEKRDRKWLEALPPSVARENHLRSVIAHLEERLQKEEDASREAEVTTKEILRKEPGLPSLGRKVPPAPMRQVTSTNVTRAYTRIGARRAKSSMR
jgi:hypothetical protein